MTAPIASEQTPLLAPAKAGPRAGTRTSVLWTGAGVVALGLCLLAAVAALSAGNVEDSLG